MNREKKQGLIGYTIATVLLAVIGYVYTLFGHGVQSPAMSYMFMYPLLAALIYRGLISSHERICLLLASITFSLGSFLKGILDIAGTSSTYVFWFYVLGSGLIVAVGVLRFILFRKTEENV